MKKLFKKSIACLIAVLMVVSTMPFTALTAQAADTSALLSAMQSFEAKMDGSVYTNMDTAYTAYVAASKAYDAAYYGGDASVDVTTPATNLNNAVSQMTKTTLSAYTANNSTVPTFGSGDNGTVANSYVNLLYTGQGTKSTVGVEDTGNVRYTFQVGYNNTVMMYDGTAPRTRVMYMCQVPRRAAGGDRSRNPMSCYPTTGSGQSGDLGSLYLVDKWKGGYNDTWNYPTQYNSGTYTFGHNSSTASAGRKIGSSWSGANPSKWFGYSNILEFNSNYNWNGSYLASFANVWWANWSGDNSKSDLLTGSSSTSIYVINYKPLKDAITADDNSTARKNVASYKEGGMSTYLAGCLSAASLNPNNYSYSTDLAGQVSQCASDISTAVSKFTTAPTADNTANYPKLRNAFDYKGALTGFNNATYSVRDAYNGGVNNGFTQASYDNFKAKYEAAQNVMKAVATTGYVNDGFAGEAATALSNAFNALQHEHSFTGAYVNNNDGTHSQKCAIYDKCQTLSTGVAHSYTSQVTTQPTCTTAGVTTYTCACGDSHTKNEPAATGHRFTTYTSNNNATCTADGTKTATCDNGCGATDTQTDTGSATGVHNYTVLQTAEVPATCTTTGTTAVYKCATCDLTTGGETINKLGHNMQVVEGSAKAPTCTVAGKEADKACSRCDYKETGAEIPATGVHSYTELVSAKQEPTCTTPGKEAVYKCATCDLTNGGATIAATGHSFTNYVSNNNATCESNATETAICDNGCGLTDTKEIADTATGHNYTSVVTKEATCTEQGIETFTCQNDNSHTYTEYIAIDENNHTGLTTLEAVAATCISTGLTEGQKCTACGVTTIPQQETDIDPDNHTDIVIDAPLDATCTDTGFTEGSHCEACDTVLVSQQTINALGHDMQVVEGSAKAPTCTEAGKEVDKACSRCDYTEDGAEIPALGHIYQYTELDADSHNVTCSRCDLNETEAHNFEGGNTCTKCLYEKSTIDTTAYDNAVAEYEAIIGAGDYAEKYTEASRTAYQAAVLEAKKESFATQEEVDAAAAAILSAKTKLVYEQPEIKFVEVDANGNETVIETKNYTYGTPVEFTKDADNIAKWIVKTQNGSVETKVATSETTYTMIATEPATVYVHLSEELTETEQYSKVSFISKNGAVSFVKYVKVGETLDTTTDDLKVEIPFYKFIGWSKASVTGTGEDIEVKAIYKFNEEEVNMCNVHYNGTSKKYAYDKFVYIDGAENKMLALSKSENTSDIITYLNENAFYAPHIEDIYVIEVDKQEASIGITGTYFLAASKPSDSKTFAFNCKMFLPEGCTLVETGLIAKSEKGTIKSKVEKVSSRGEFTAKLKVGANSTVTSVTGKAYLTYKNASNQLVTIYSEEVVLAQ